jgi:hypothetical protein
MTIAATNKLTKKETNMDDNIKQASDKQMQLIAKHGMPTHSDTLTMKEASAIIDTFAKANGWTQKEFTPQAKSKPVMPDEF